MSYVRVYNKRGLLKYLSSTRLNRISGADVQIYVVPPKINARVGKWKPCGTM